MSEYSGRIIGVLPPTCHKDESYFLMRFCTVDCRGPLEVHANSYFGIGVKLVTTSHDLSNWPEFGKMLFKPVIVCEGAWVASFSVLHNCTIKAHAIVSIGSVVNGLVVPEYGFVAGNPARLLGFFYQGVLIPKDRWEGPVER